MRFYHTGDALTWLAKDLGIPYKAAVWLYENTACPPWYEIDFQFYQFWCDPRASKIPKELMEGKNPND